MLVLRAALLAALPLLLLSLAGCGDSGGGPVTDPDASDGPADVEEDPPPPPPVLSVDDATGGWSLESAETGALLVGATGRVDVPASGEPEVVGLFGAFQIDLDAADWVTADAGATVTTAGDTTTTTWEPEGLTNPVSLVVEPWGDGHTRVALTGGDVAGGAIHLEVPANTSWFGLGNQTVGPDLAGRRYPLWTQEQGIGKPDDGGLFPVNNIPEAAYAPMGVWHTTAGWSAVLDVDAYTELDLREDGAAIVRSWGERPAFIVFSHPDPKERLKAITEVIGRVPPPPPWVFGPWNDAVGGPEHLHQVRATLRDNDIPSSAIWSEDWIGGEEGPSGYRLSYAWAWDPEQYPDLPGDIEQLHADGFAFLAYFNPFVPEPTDMWDEGVAGGWLIEDVTGGTYTFTDPAGRDASLVDLTDPAAVDWLKGYLTLAAQDLDIDGWMADFAEWMPHDAVLASGIDPWILHNRYPVLWQQANHEAMTAVHDGPPSTAEGWTFFARSGWASTRQATAAYAPTMWGGDQNTTWERDDGLPTVIPMGIHVGLSGVPIFGTDIAGYSAFTNDPTDKELFYRWASLAAFHPLMRTHHGSSECANWSFDRDADTLAHYRRWASIHTLLYPHWKRLAEEAVETGLPMMRHAWLVEPDKEAMWAAEADLWFSGDDVLVAPVVQQGATYRTVHLPESGWWPLFGTAAELAEGDVIVDSEVTELPVFVRPGTVLPLLPEVIDSHYGAPSDDVTDLDDVAGRWRLALYPGEGGALTTTQVEDATISGSINPDPPWLIVQVDGVPVPHCDLAEPGTSCHEDVSLTVVGTSASVDTGDAVLHIESDTPGTWTLAIARTAWGEWAEPTTVGDLDPDIPPPCEEE